MLVEVYVLPNRNTKIDKKSDWSQKLKCYFNDLMQEWRIFFHHGSDRKKWLGCILSASLVKSLFRAREI